MNRTTNEGNKEHEMKHTISKVKVWLAKAVAETPGFCKLCKTMVLLLIKSIKKENALTEKTALLGLRAKTKNAQVAFGGVGVAIVLVLLIRACGGSSTHESEPRVVSAPSGKIEPRTEQRVKMNLTAQDVFARKVSATLHQIAFVRERPREGEVWENNIPVITVRQVVEGGVLAETERSSISPELGTRLFFVRTSRTYADGDKLATGFYLCTGMYSYVAVSGAKRTVLAFEELPKSLQQELYGMVAKKNKEMFEREAQRKQIVEEEQKHPTTVDSWLKSVLRGIGIHDDINESAGGAFTKLKADSYVFPMCLDHYGDSIHKRLTAKGWRDWQLKKEYQRLAVRTFAQWVFTNKIQTTKAFLDKFMPTLQFDDPGKNLVVQKSLRDKVEIRWDRKYIAKLIDMQKNRDWLGLLNEGFENGHQMKEIKDDVAYWLTYDALMRKLASRPMEVYIYAEKDEKIKFVSDSIDVDEFRIRPDARSTGIGGWNGKIPFNAKSKTYVRESTMELDRALSKLGAGFEERKKKIIAEYRLPIDPEDEQTMKKRIEALKEEFKGSYEKWLEEH